MHTEQEIGVGLGTYSREIPCAGKMNEAYVEVTPFYIIWERLPQDIYAQKAWRGEKLGHNGDRITYARTIIAIYSSCRTAFSERVEIGGTLSYLYAREVYTRRERKPWIKKLTVQVRGLKNYTCYTHMHSNLSREYKLWSWGATQFSWYVIYSTKILYVVHSPWSGREGLRSCFSQLCFSCRSV